jgi:hypothetical protein
MNLCFYLALAQGFDVTAYSERGMGIEKKYP